MNLNNVKLQLIASALFGSLITIGAYSFLSSDSPNGKAISITPTKKKTALLGRAHGRELSARKTG